MHKIDPYEYITNIRDRLKKEDFHLVMKEIDDRLKEGNSGTEILMSVTHYLKKLNETNPKAFQLVSSEVENLIKYLYSIGLIIT